MKRPVIVDATDTRGSLAALKWINEAFDLRGVTVAQGADADTVCGMCALLGLTCPVVKGAEKPILREKREAGKASRPVLPKGNVMPGYAWDFFMYQAELSPHELEIIALGSLSNLAIASVRYPALEAILGHITLYAGARFAGNVPQAPQSEWNLYDDPEAGYMALHMSTEKLAVDLNTVAGVAFTPQEANTLCAFAVCDTLDKEIALPELLCAVLASAGGSLCDVRLLNVTVETDSPLTRGQLVIEYDTVGKGVLPNCGIIFECDSNEMRQRALHAFDER